MDIDLILEYCVVGLLASLYIALISFFLWLIGMSVWDEIKFRRTLKKRKF